VRRSLRQFRFQRGDDLGAPAAPIHTKVYGPTSSFRFWNPTAISASSRAITLTCDLLRPVGPSEAASFSTRRVETPQQATGRHLRRQRPLRPAAVLQERRENSTRAAASGSPARRSRPGCSTPRAGSRYGSSRGPGWPPRIRRRTPPPPRHPSSAGRTAGSSPAACPGSPRSGSPRTTRPGRAQCHLRPLRSPSSHTRISRDHELAASRHGTTPYFGKRVTSGSATPYTTSVDASLSAQHHARLLRLSTRMRQERRGRVMTADGDRKES
jgi:hypothetical protein